MSELVVCLFTEHLEPEHQTAAEDVQRPAGEQTHAFKNPRSPHPHVTRLTVSGQGDEHPECHRRGRVPDRS